jgi:peptidyl-prolyl cis-trans isomerase SurA
MPRRASWFLALALAAGTALAAHPAPAHAQSETIAAVVNGSPITTGDVDDRTKLFALSTGMSLSPDVLARLRPQVTRQLIEERLRLQEIEKRKIVVQDQEIADAIKEIEQRNNMPSGTLQARLASSGAGMSTLVNELRVQIGWTRVLREALGPRAQITQSEIAGRQALLKSQEGQPEYNVSEIFIPVDNPTHAADAQRFAATVIQELRAGAPFPVVAAQFSQDQTALEGGALGWVRTNQLDPEVAKIVTQMPPGAISDPIAVPGGFSIVALRAKREVGRDLATYVSIRQVFLPFSTPLNPQAPTDQQRQTLEHARQISASVKSCDDVEAANKAANSGKQSDLGEIRLDQLNPPQLRTLLTSLPIGKATPPLIAGDGVAVIMVCSRDQKNAAELTSQDVASQLLHERVEMQSRALDRDLRRRAIIDQRASAS